MVQGPETPYPKTGKPGTQGWHLLERGRKQQDIFTCMKKKNMEENNMKKTMIENNTGDAPLKKAKIKFEG